MKACWIDHGQDADITKLKRHGIDEILVPTQSSPIANAGSLERLKNAGFKVGLFVAWSWRPGVTGAQFAEFVDRELKRVGWLGNPKVQVDIEKGAGLHDANYVDYVVAFMRRWRQLRPTRETDFTLEAMQGGLFNGRGDAIEAIIEANVRIIPQFYTGDMQPMAQDVALKDLLLYGFPIDRIKGYYDGARLPLNWDGVAWTQGRLP